MRKLDEACASEPNPQRLTTSLPSAWLLWAGGQRQRNRASRGAGSGLLPRAACVCLMHTSPPSLCVTNGLGLCQRAVSVCQEAGGSRQAQGAATRPCSWGNPLRAAAPEVGYVPGAGSEVLLTEVLLIRHLLPRPSTPGILGSASPRAAHRRERSGLHTRAAQGPCALSPQPPRCHLPPASRLQSASVCPQIPF